MGFTGMDTAVVGRVSAGLEAQADRLDAVAAEIDRLMRSAMQHWQGREAQDFHHWWVQQHRARMRAIAHSLHVAAAGLRRQTEEQERVSALFRGLPARGPGAEEPSARDLLALSSASYDRSGSVVVDGRQYTRVSDAELRRLGIDPRLMHNDLIGFSATLYRAADGSYVLAFAGTDPAAPQDLMTDVQGATGVSAQSAAAILLAKRLDSKLGDDLSFTGHSLGGRLAAVSAIATGNEATTFNAAGVSDEEFALALAAAGRDPHLLENAAKNGAMSVPFVGLVTDGPDLYGAERRELEARVTAYYGGADPLTIAQETSGAPDAVGKQVYVDSGGRTGIDAHNVDGLSDGLPR